MRKEDKVPLTVMVGATDMEFIGAALDLAEMRWRDHRHKFSDDPAIRRNYDDAVRRVRNIRSRYDRARNRAEALLSK